MNEEQSGEGLGRAVGITMTAMRAAVRLGRAVSGGALPSRRVAAASTGFLAGISIGVSSASAGTLPRVAPACVYDYTVISSPPHQSGLPITLSVWAMNDHGEVLGHRNLLGGHVPFFWSAEEGVVPMPLPAGTSTSYAITINNNGWILINGHGSYGGDRGFIVPPEVRLTPSAWIRIDPVDPSIPFAYSYVRGINDQNEVVGNRSADELQPMSSFPHWGYWWSPTSGGPVDVVIEGPEGNDSSGLRSINDSGVMLGWTSVSVHHSTTTVSWLLDDVQAVPFSAPSSNSVLIPMHVNDAGDALLLKQTQIGPGIGDITQAMRIVRSDGAVQDLAPLPGYARGVGYTVSNAGVVGGHSKFPTEPGLTSQIPVVWFDGVPIDVNELVDVPQSLVGALFDVRAVNNCGQILIRGTSGGLLLTPAGVFGDLDCDGVVGLSDLALLLANWGAEGTRADLDGSGVVDGADLGQLLMAWSR